MDMACLWNACVTCLMCDMCDLFLCLKTERIAIDVTLCKGKGSKNEYKHYREIGLLSVHGKGFFFFLRTLTEMVLK